jgi:hypothetical protein
MYIVILLLTVVFSAVAVGGNIPKADPYPSEKPVEVNINPAIKKADSQGTLQMYTFTGERIIPTPACPVGGNVEVMFIIDYSGSTEGEKLDKEKAAASVFIDTLARNPQNRFGFVIFNEKGRLVSPLSSDFTSVKRAVNSLPDGDGYTCIKCGIEAANSHLASNARPGLPKVVVLLSDGYANRPEPKDVAIQLTKDTVSQGHQQQKITYYPIGFSGDVINKKGSSRFGGSFGEEGVNEPVMRELAALGGGKYYFAPTNADLESVLHELGVSLICDQQQSAPVVPIAAPVTTIAP